MNTKLMSILYNVMGNFKHFSWLQEFQRNFIILNVELLFLLGNIYMYWYRSILTSTYTCHDTA